MDFERYHIYEVVGEAALAKRDAYRELSKQKAANAEKWAESHGGVKALNRGQFLCGITTPIDGKPKGPGWKKGDHQPNPDEVWWIYNHRTKAGMAIEREINKSELRQATANGLASAIGANVCFIDDRRCMMESQAFDMGDRVFLIIPKQPDKPAPEIDGCRLIKLSEFYAIKEAAEAVPA